jgi:hypothetical protein
MTDKKARNAALADAAHGAVLADNLALLELLADALTAEREGYSLARMHSGKLPTWPNVGDQQRLRADLRNIAEYVLGAEMTAALAENFTDVDELAANGAGARKFRNRRL